MWRGCEYNFKGICGLLYLYQIPEGCLPAALFIGFRNKDSISEYQHYCDLGANEFLSVLRLTELKRRAACIAKINQCVKSLQNERETFYDICRIIRDYFKVNAATISMVKDRNKNEIIFEKYYLHDDRNGKEVFHATKGFSHYCVTTEQPFLVTKTKMETLPFIGRSLVFNTDDINVDKGYLKNIEFIRTKKTGDDEDEKSLMFVPLHNLYNGEVIGVMKIGEFNTYWGFNEFDLQSLVILASDLNFQDKLVLAKKWVAWEKTVNHLYELDHSINISISDKDIIVFATLECHYFLQKGFFEHDNIILSNINKIKDIPIDIIQGRYDLVCPYTSAQDLADSHQNSVLSEVRLGGHSAFDKNICHAIVKQMNKLSEVYNYVI